MKKWLIVGLLALSVVMIASAGTLKPLGQLEGDIFVAFRNMQKAQLDATYNDPIVSTISASIASLNLETTVSYTLDGVYKELGPSAGYTINQPDSSLPTQTAGTARKYLVSIGDEGFSTVDVGVGTAYPKVPDGFAPLVGLRITVDAGGVYRIGKTLWGATSVNTEIIRTRVPVDGPSKVSLKNLPKP